MHRDGRLTADGPIFLHLLVVGDDINSGLITSFFKSACWHLAVMRMELHHAWTCLPILRRGAAGNQRKRSTAVEAFQALKGLCLSSGRRWSFPLCWFCWYSHLLEEIYSWASPLTQESQELHRYTYMQQIICLRSGNLPVPPPPFFFSAIVGTYFILFVRLLFSFFFLIGFPEPRVIALGL